MNILFVGNSYTFFNDMPQLFYKTAQENGQAVVVDSVTKGGRRLCENLNENDEWNRTIRGLAAQKKYDVLILQEQSFFALVDFEKFEDGIRGLMDLVSPARTLLYATWGRKTGAPLLEERGWTSEGMTASLAEAYALAAKHCGAEVAHVGRCFARLGSLHPMQDLYRPDLSHPSYFGSCVAALSLYKHVFGALPQACETLGLEEEERRAVLETVAQLA